MKERKGREERSKRRMNNNRTQLKRHQVAFVFKMAKRKHAIHEKRKKTMVGEVEGNWKRACSFTLG